MTCTCGDVMNTEANSREEAVGKFMEMMTPEAVVAHFGEKHKGEPVPNQDQVRAGLEATVQEAPAAM